jgi:hypothetical protein
LSIRPQPAAESASIKALFSKSWKARNAPMTAYMYSTNFLAHIQAASMPFKDRQGLGRADKRKEWRF